MIDTKELHAPQYVAVGLCLLVVLPSTLAILGFDFSIDNRDVGVLVHTILEWSSVMIAMITSIMAFAIARSRNEPIVALIGMTLFCSGSMDVFHILSGDGLLGSSNDRTNLIPFSWALSRIFNAAICLIGVLIALRFSQAFRQSRKLWITFCAAIPSVAFLAIFLTVKAPSLPQTQFPDAIITRPWDVLPLGLYIVAAFVYRKYYRDFPSTFSFCLLLSTIPHVFTELHIAFGSTALFDHHFNVAHTLKSLAYLVPFVGLCADYLASLKRAREQDATIRMENKVIWLIQSLNRRISDRQVSVEKAFEFSIAEICRLMTWDVGHAYFADPNFKKMHPGNIWYLTDPTKFSEFKKITERTSFTIGEGLPGRVLESKTVRWIEDINVDTNYPRNASGAHLALTTGVGIPVLYLDEVHAVLEFYSQEKRMRRNQPIAHLKLFCEQLSQFFARKFAEIEIESQRQKALAASKAKSNFLANMSHEIRTPMNGVLGVAELLSEESLTPHQTNLVMTIIESANSMVEILNDILDYSKIESGKLEIEVRNIELSKVLKTVGDTFRGRITEKRLRYHLQVAANVPEWIASDSTRIRQVLSNLVSNAIKFTESGEISLSVSVLEQVDDQVRLEFSVQDSGIGIAPDKIATIFDQFSQGDSSTTRRYGGSGLGLAICNQLAKALDGDVSVESQPGKGSTFRFRMQTHIAEKQEARRNSDRGLDSGFDTIRTLIVEDNPTNLLLVAARLKKLGIKPDSCTNGAQALEMISKTTYDLVLMDCQMPIMDGYIATGKIRDMRLAKQPVVLALTANALLGAREKCLRSGMDDFLAKPFSANEFKEKIAEWFGGTACEPEPTSEPPATKTGNSHVIDVKKILSDFGDEEDILAEFCDDLIRQLPKYVEEIASSLGARSADDLERAAHTLKGLMRNFGGLQIVEDLQHLENLGRESKFHDAEPAFDDIKRLLEPTVQEIEQLRSKLQRAA